MCTDAYGCVLEIRTGIGNRNRKSESESVDRNLAVNIVQATKAIVSSFAAISNSVINLSNKLGGVSHAYEKMFGDKETTEAVQKKIEKIDDAILSTTKSMNSWWGVSKKGGRETIIMYQMQKEALQELIDTNKTLGQSTDIELFNVKPTMKSLDQLEAKLLKITTDNVSGDVTTTQTTVVDVTGTTGNERFAREYEFQLDHDRRMLELNRNRLDAENADKSAAYGVAFEMQRKSSRMLETARRKDADDLRDEGRGALASLSSHYKAAFALNKSFALKDAIINTYNGVAKALNNPFPLNLGFAAVALANGMKQEARAAKQQQAYERGLKRAEKLSKGALASEQKRSLKYASVEQKRYLKAQIQKRKLESAEKLRQEILLSAEHMKQCESVLEYVVSEVEERYWEEHVPQSNPDALYAGSLRFLANVLNQSRIVNRPKTQAMYAYASLARQWHDNYLDRIRSAPELMSKVAASQVLYFDGLRFSEYEFVAQVLPSLKAQLLTSLKELDEAIGSGAAWAQYQKDICASGISRLATNKDLEDLQENYSALIYKKPMERFTKRIKQNYKARGGQPAFIPKHRTQEGRNSLKKV